MCEHAGDYRWCSHAAAMGGNVVSRRGLARAWGRTKWTATRLREHQRCRERYFNEGGVLGSLAFSDRFFERERPKFGEKRESGACAMNGGEWGGVMEMRNLGQ
ncbi:MAG: hypothetical protein O3C21_09950 [Verrucomicrobia bacterium]|nr:hypothetical protein [Verrucomicrobiota bacterium]